MSEQEIIVIITTDRKGGKIKLEDRRRKN